MCGRQAASASSIDSPYASCCPSKTDEYCRSFSSGLKLLTSSGSEGGIGGDASGGECGGVGGGLGVVTNGVGGGDGDGGGTVQTGST